jgi:hypothetical protein
VVESTFPVAPADERRRIVALLLTPLLVRALLIAFAGARGLTLEQLATTRGDTDAFLGLARVLLDPSGAAEFAASGASRVFPLWPLVLTGPVALGSSPVLLLSVVPLLCSLAAYLLYCATRQFHAALLLGVAPPALLLSTSTPMSEGLYIALGVGAAYLFGSGQLLIAGILAGLMVAVRPFGITAAAAGAILLALMPNRRLADLGYFVGGVALGGLPLVVVNIAMFGDLFHQVRVYGSDLDRLNIPAAAATALGGASGHWGLPFKHLLITPWRIEVPAWKIAYIYAHLGAILALVPLAIRELLRDRLQPTAANLLIVAFLLNSALSVCTGPYWGFFTFDRYVTWGAPGALLLVTRIWPERRTTLLFGAASIAISFVGIYRWTL